MSRHVAFWFIAILSTFALIGCADNVLGEASDDDDDGWDDDDYADDDDDTGDDDTGDDDDDDDDYTGDDDTVGDDDDTGDDDDDDDTTEEPEDVCDDAPVDPTTLYMSADDSNSQASPVWARQMILAGEAIHHAGDIRLYEFLNYYGFYYPPAAEDHVRVVPQVVDNGDGAYTVLVGVVSPSVADLTRRPRALTFSVDSSGSMTGHPMDMVKASMRAIAHNLEEGDVVSVMSWDTTVATLLDGHEIVGPDDPALLDVIDGITPGGSTDLHSGLVAAYDVAHQTYSEDRLNRVILLSDGGANAGVTEEDLIALHADDGEAEGIFLVGVGADDNPQNYDDDLMDTITDAGKGAYVYIDSEDEAEAILGDDDRFLAVMEIAARDVQLSVTLPAGYVLDEFHGEDVSPNPEEVDPQHLGPGDAMLYHFELLDCTTDEHDGEEMFEFVATWEDPLTREARSDTVSMSTNAMVDDAGLQLRKANAIIAYAQALTEVWNAPDEQAYIDAVVAEIEAAYFDTGDTDLAEIVELLRFYDNQF